MIEEKSAILKKKGLPQRVYLEFTEGKEVRKLARSFVSQVLVVASVACVIFAGYGFLFGDVWLASTQWLIAAAVLGAWAVWVKGCC